MIKIPTEIYSRVSGYYRPVQQWHKGKQEEFKERRYLKFTPAVCSEGIDALCIKDN